MNTQSIGNIIRANRRKLDLTQEELGQRLNPPVHKGAVNKWESGQVSNIRRDHIEQMSKLFGITAAELLGFKKPEVEEAIEILPSKEHESIQRVIRYIDRLTNLEILRVIRDAADMKLKSIDEPKKDIRVQMPDGSYRVIKFKSKEGDNHEDA